MPRERLVVTRAHACGRCGSRYELLPDEHWIEMSRHIAKCPGCRERPRSWLLFLVGRPLVMMGAVIGVAYLCGIPWQYFGAMTGAMGAGLARLETRAWRTTRLRVLRALPPAARTLPPR
jgi:hypothetical protein